jgi:hypothetical protein
MVEVHKDSPTLDASSDSRAREVHGTIENNTGHGYKFVSAQFEVNSGEFLSDPPTTIAANSKGSFTAGSNASMGGISGSVRYQADYNTNLWIEFDFSNPYIGSNSYGYSYYDWVDITTSGGGGCDAYVTYHVVSCFFIYLLVVAVIVCRAETSFGPMAILPAGVTEPHPTNTQEIPPIFSQYDFRPRIPTTKKRRRQGPGTEESKLIINSEFVTCGENSGRVTNQDVRQFFTTFNETLKHQTKIIETTRAEIKELRTEQ